MTNEDTCCNENDNKNKNIDLIVIGAGSAGFSGAITAAEKGKKVLIIGDGTIGGTCVNVGCVPSKTMIRAVDTLFTSKHAKRFEGIESSAKVLNWKALVEQKQSLVDDLRVAKYINVLPSYPNVTYIEGKAFFSDKGVRVNGDIYQTKKTLISTGSRSKVPPIKGIEQVSCLDSTSALELTKLPKSMIVIGGGVIGCELSQMFARAGVEVTLCCRSRLLPDMEPEISLALEEYLSQEGIIICTGIGYQKLEEDTGGVHLTCENVNGVDTKAIDRVITAEKLLLATGRVPNTGNMGLENVGVKLAKSGGIIVNDNMQSSNLDIYAAGDVTGREMFVYMAAYGAKVAASNAFNYGETSYSSKNMPAVVFTDPQVASVGLTEAAARTNGYDVKTSNIGLNHVPRYIAARDERGLIKLVADKKTDKLLGAHILAPEGGELIQTMVIALKAGMTTEELGSTIFPYLTGVEGLKLAAQTFDKDVSKLSCCAG